jgi:hypothetical protein
VLAATGSYVGAYFAAIGLLTVSLTLVVLLRQPSFTPEQIIDDLPPVDARQPASTVPPVALAGS